ncbi:MAG TPA: Flp pilus assembly protein CpaB [Nitrospirota bacterium]|nr:Flp pilus assembly protein CpaB [Nitrospirota bacterium]
MARPARTTAIVAAVALILASAAAYLVFNFLSSKEMEASKARLDVQPVVVAAMDIPFGTKILPEHVKTVDWPKASLPAGSSADPRSLEGRITVASVPMGAPVQVSSLAPAAADSGVMSVLVPQGKRAFTVAVNEVVGVAGFVLPNSIVDVVATVNSPYQTSGDQRISKIILQNIRVLAVGQTLEQKEGKPVTVPTVTLDVTPEEAEKLAIASENKVQLVLKHMGDTDEVKTRGATVASILGAAPPAQGAGAKRTQRPAAKAPARAPAREPGVFVDIIKGGVRTKEEFR